MKSEIKMEEHPYVLKCNTFLTVEDSLLKFIALGTTKKAGITHCTYFETSQQINAMRGSRLLKGQIRTLSAVWCTTSNKAG